MPPGGFFKNKLLMVIVHGFANAGFLTIEFSGYNNLTYSLLFSNEE